MTKTAPTLPAFGAAFEGGIYGGLTVNKAGEIYIPILSPLRAPKGTHQQQLAWAEKNGLNLLNRVEGALFFSTIPDEFEKGLHWLEEPYGSDGAYCQHFSNGYQNLSGRFNKFLCRGVRRLTLGSFDTLGGAIKRAAESVAQLRDAARTLLAACDSAEVAEAREAA